MSDKDIDKVVNINCSFDANIETDPFDGVRSDDDAVGPVAEQPEFIEQPQFMAQPPVVEQTPIDLEMKERPSQSPTVAETAAETSQSREVEMKESTRVIFKGYAAKKQKRIDKMCTMLQSGNLDELELYGALLANVLGDDTIAQIDEADESDIQQIIFDRLQEVYGPKMFEIMKNTVTE